MRVVAFTGMPGAGKSEAVAVARARGVPVIRMGDFVWAETRRRGLAVEDAHVGRVATEMRQRHGMDYWARLTCDEVQARHGDAGLLVIDGVRNHEEVDTFRQRLGDRFELVAIEAPFEVRAARLHERGRSDDPAAVEDVRARDERERGWGIERTIRAADRKLTNTGDLAAFRQAVERLFGEWGPDGPG